MWSFLSPIIPRRNFNLKMIKRCALLLLCTVLLTSLASCQSVDTPTSDTVEVVYYTVSFESNGGSKVQSARVLPSKATAEPTAPTKDGYIFDHWSYNGKEWDFTFDKVTEDITLSAVWIDAAAVYAYTPTDGGVCISGIKRNMPHMQIPSLIGGLYVVAIGDSVFADAQEKGITKITVPASVKNIGKAAFRACKDIEISVLGELSELGELAFFDCNKLNKIKFADTLQSIPPGAFTGCESLESVVLPQSVTSIGENAFEDCTALKSVTLTKAVVKIEDSAFIGCDSLESINFNGTRADFDAIEIASNNNEFKAAELHTEG